MRRSRATAVEGPPPVPDAGCPAAASACDPLVQLQTALHTLHVAHQRIAFEPAHAAAALREAIATLEHAVPDLRAELLAGGTRHLGGRAHGGRS